MTKIEPNEQEHSSSVEHIRDRGPVVRFLRIALFSFGVLLALYLGGILLMRIVNVEQLSQAQKTLRLFGEWWVIVRVIFIASLIIYWKEINNWLARRNGWTDAHLQRVLSGRWFTLGMLCFVELFLVQRIHEPFTDRWFN